MTTHRSPFGLKLIGCAVVAATIALSSTTASAQGRQGRDRGPQIDIVVTQDSGFSGSRFSSSRFGGSRFGGSRFGGRNFNNRQNQGPFADMPRSGDRRIVRWLAEKPLRWHVRMSREFSRRYENRVTPHLRDMPRRWQTRMHNSFHGWYQANVARSHRLIGGRIGRRNGHNDGHSPNIVNHNNPPQGRPTPNNRPGHGRTAAPVLASHGSSGGQNCTINAGSLLGAALGGFLGSKIGGGSGRLAATAAGTFLGAAIGGQQGCR